MLVSGTCSVKIWQQQKGLAFWDALFLYGDGLLFELGLALLREKRYIF